MVTLINETDIILMKSLSKEQMFFIILSFSILSVALVYQPLPTNFPQPWKYRFLSFWAHMFSKLVKYSYRKTKECYSV